MTMADNRWRLFTAATTLDRQTGDLTVRSIENRPNTREGVSPSPAVTALIERYDTLSAIRANTVVGSITSDIDRSTNEAGESALEDVVADAHLAATRGAGAVVALMKLGGNQGLPAVHRLGE